MGSKENIVLNKWDWYDTPEVFSFLAASWDIAYAKNIFSGRKKVVVGEIDVQPWAEMLGREKEDGSYQPGIGTNQKELENEPEQFDLEFPCIIAQVKNSKGGYFPMIIDGWHRVARASREGVKKIPCVVLNKNDSRSVRLR